MVINYDFPATSASYIHRIGRTGKIYFPFYLLLEKDNDLVRSASLKSKNRIFHIIQLDAV